MVPYAGIACASRQQLTRRYDWRIIQVQGDKRQGRRCVSLPFRCRECYRAPLAFKSAEVGSVGWRLLSVTSYYKHDVLAHLQRDCGVVVDLEMGPRVPMCRRRGAP